MSVYVMSDLHGMSLDELKALLCKAEFCGEDLLYILGDIIDRRGDGGIEVLRWIMKQPNVKVILGNHEEMLLNCGFLFEDIKFLPSALLEEKNKKALELYRESGGDVTLEALRKLARHIVLDILSYLRSCPLYAEITVNNRPFILVHSGIDNFDKSKSISDYTPRELLWAWPEYDDEYFEDITTIFGHTPTIFYDRSIKGRILRRPTWTDIDVGASYGYGAAMLRLEDMREFYL